MAATRVKKTISFNPLAADTQRKTRLLDVAKPTAPSASPRPPKASTAAAKKISPDEVKTPAVKKVVTSTKKSPVKAPSTVATAPKKKSAKTTPTISAAPKKKPAKKVESVPLETLQPPVDEPVIPAEPIASNSAHEALAEQAVVIPKKTWFAARHSVQAYDGHSVTSHEIVVSKGSKALGFNDRGGAFVSLMHLEGPIDDSNSTFFPLAIAGFALGGPLGIAAASLFGLRKQTIYLARQSAGNGTYVSLGWRDINYLKRNGSKVQHLVSAETATT